MKYLFSLTIIMITVFISFSSYSAVAQTIPISICNLSWWQQLIQNNVPINENDISLNDLYRSCDEDKSTPLMIAYFAGVSDEILTLILDLAVGNTIRELLFIRNIHGESFIQVLSDKYESDITISLTTSTQLRIKTPSEEVSPSPFFGDVCDTWRQQFEGGDNTFTENIRNINIDDLLKSCSSGDKPLITALRANIDGGNITRLLEIATTNTLRDLFNLEHVRGDTLRTIFLRRHNPGAMLSFNVDISITIED